MNERGMLMEVPSIEEELASLRAEVTKLQGQLAECYRLSGADPDGDSDAMLAEHAVEEVRRLREETDAEAALLRAALEEAKELLRADAVENRILRSAFNVLTAALTPAPVERCETECDKGSRCTLPAEHGDRHETEHGCIAYDPRPTPAPVEGEGEARTPPPLPVRPLGSAPLTSSVLACAQAPERDPSPFDPRASAKEVGL